MLAKRNGFNFKDAKATVSVSTNLLLLDFKIRVGFYVIPILINSLIIIIIILFLLWNMYLILGVYLANISNYYRWRLQVDSSKFKLLLI